MRWGTIHAGPDSALPALAGFGLPAPCARGQITLVDNCLMAGPTAQWGPVVDTAGPAADLDNDGDIRINDFLLIGQPGLTAVG